MKYIENFLLNKFAGKLIARGAVLAGSYIASTLAAPVIAGTPLPFLAVTLDPAQVTGWLMTVGMGAFEWFKARRMANPSSPAVQTDAAKPGSETPAVSALEAVK